MAALSPIKEYPIWEDLLLEAFPCINNGLMEIDQDVIWALEAAIYPTAADRLRTIFGNPNMSEKKNEFINWVKEKNGPDGFESFAEFANFLEEHDSEICSKFDIGPTLSYIKLDSTPFGTLDLEDNISGVIELLNKSSCPELGSLLIDISDYGSSYILHFIDYIQQAVQDDSKYGWIDLGIGNQLHWTDFVEVFRAEKEKIRHLLDTESQKWFYNSL